MSNSLVTQRDIAQGLSFVGLQQSDVVEVHSSLSAFGRVEGGADAVVDALMNVVGERGTIVMPAYRVGVPVPLTPEEQARGITWKVKMLTDDSEEKTGRGAGVAPPPPRPGVVLGKGIHRTCAWGRDAERHVEGFRHLVELDGCTLLLGVGIDRCSSLHLGEDVTLPDKIMAYFKIPDDIQRDYDPNVWSIGYGDGKDAPLDDAWSKVHAQANQCGWIQHHRIGDAECQLFKTKRVGELYAAWRRTDPYGLFGVAKD
jgi:aminoglycoside 3-N-acetyltransferase